MPQSFPSLPKSKEGAARQVDSLIRSYRRDFAGGGAFGFDWSTFRINSPERYARIVEIKGMFDALPSRKRA